MKIHTVYAVREWVHFCVQNSEIIDLHTHLFAPCFGNLLRLGIDDVLTYHYLVEETVLATGMSPASYWSMPKHQQAELNWETLFLERMPVSEACRTVLTMFQRDGLESNIEDLNYYREYYSRFTPDEYVRRVFSRENIKGVFMTNDPFNSSEFVFWLNGSYYPDSRFLTALRIDELLLYKKSTVDLLNKWGYVVDYIADGRPSPLSMPEICRFICDWMERMSAGYCAVSLPVSFSLEDDSVCAAILTECVLPVCRERKIPLALMLGVTRKVHSAMQEAGDSLGKIDIRQLHKLFREYRENLFLVTTLARENQHELTATARIFSNVMLFGCWWYLSNPVFMEEMTKMRYEMLGPKFVAQHSDANMLGHLVGKWNRFRVVLERVLARYYEELISMGYYPDDERIREEINDLCGGYYYKFLNRSYQA